MKGKLKIWNKLVFGILDLEVEEAIKNLNGLDNMVAEETGNDIPAGVVNNTKDASKKVREVINLKENVLRHKSMMKWIKE